ncbi:MAG: HAD family phosphatase [Desulfobacteraceae bacterium]|nr:HAD family phosphatase [Desulfobacteraceae bacterium]
MQKKLFITDFDGTLLRDRKTISKDDINALTELKEQGIIRCIATGRSIYSFLKTLKTFPIDSHLEFPIDYLIFSTGAGIMDFNTGAILKSFSLNESDVINIADYFEKYKLDYMVHKPVPDTNYFVYKSFGNENKDFNDRINLYQKYSSLLDESKGLNGFGKSTEVLAIIPLKSVFASPEQIEKIKHDLSKFSVIIATSPLDKKSLWVEVFNKDVSKSKAASILAQKLMIKRKDVFSIGNDYNDLDLLEWSGNAFVVGNALSEFKNRFEQVPSNNDSGVRAAIEKCIKA